MAFDAGTINARLTIDRSDFTRGLTSSQVEAARFASSRPTVELAADAAGVTGPVAAAQSAVNSFAGQEADARLGADISGLMSAATTANTTVAQLAGLEADVKVTGDTSSLAAAATRAQSFAAQIAALAPTIRVTAQDAATARLQTIQGIAHEVGLLAPEVTVTADVVAADAKLQYINRVLSGIDGRHVNATVDVDVDNARNNLQGFTGDLDDADTKTGDLTSRLKSADSAMRVLATGGIIAATGALGPLGAAALVAGGALAGVAAGFGLVGAAAIGTFNDIEFKEGQFVAKEGATLTQSQQRLVGSLNAFAGAYAAAMAPAQNAVAALATTILTSVTPALGAIGTTANLAVLAVGRAFDTLMTSFTVPAQLAIFQNFLAGIPGLVETATAAAGKLALALFDIFAVPVTSGLAQQLLGYIDDLATRFLDWVQSAGGQNAIATFFQQAGAIAGPLATAVGQIAVGFGQLVNSGVAAELATNIALLLGTIGSNLPTLIPFITAINGLLTAFNALPQPLQNAIVQLILINAVMGQLGISPLNLLTGALLSLGIRAGIFAATGVQIPGILSLIGSAIAGLGSAISTAFFAIVGTLGSIASSIATFFAVSLPAAVGVGAAPLYAALLTIVGSWTYILGPAGIIVGILIAFAAFLAGGWVLLVVAAVASAAIAIATALYRNWATIQAAIDNLVARFRALPGALQAAFLSTISALNPAFAIQAAIMAAYNWLTSTGTPTLTSWFSSLPGWLQSALTTNLLSIDIFSALYDAVNAVVAWFQANGAEGILNWFSNLPSWAANALSTALSSVSLFGPIFDAVTAAYDWFAGGGFNGIILAFSNLAGSLARGVWDGISNNPLFQAVFNAVDSFFTWVNGLWDSFKSLGEHLINGFINGVIAAGKALITAVVTPVKAAYQAVVDFLQPGSPSKLFYRLASTVPQGIIAAFRDGEKMVAAGASRLVDVAGIDFKSPTPSFAGGSSVGGSGISGKNLPAAVSSSLQRRGRRRKQQPIIIQNHVILDGKELAKWVNDTTHEAFRTSQLRGDYLGGGL